MVPEPEVKIYVKPDGEPCGGHCKHSSLYHTVKLAGPTNTVWGCAKVDCPCMELKPPIKS